MLNPNQMHCKILNRQSNLNYLLKFNKSCKIFTIFISVKTMNTGDVMKKSAMVFDATHQLCMTFKCVGNLLNRKVLYLLRGQQIYFILSVKPREE